MEWVRRGRDRRADPRLVFPETKSLFCVLLPYPAKPHGQQDPQEGVRYARYLAGGDYHSDLAHRLDRAIAQIAPQYPDLRWKTCVDTSAVLERSWASLSGLGWIGKNTLLIHPKLGSFTFIGVALLNQELGAPPRVPPNWCGSCERCLKSCPTRAFPLAGVLDSNRCIAALTLEYRGDVLPEDPQLSTRNWIAGCDICQEVCPFNQKRITAESPPQQAGNQPSRWEELLSESEQDYKNRIRGSALSRVKFAMFRRNLAAALKNSGRDQPSPATTQE
jgi:epoxyqueuosine reductase